MTIKHSKNPLTPHAAGLAIALSGSQVASGTPVSLDGELPAEYRQQGTRQVEPASQPEVETDNFQTIFGPQIASLHVPSDWEKISLKAGEDASAIQAKWYVAEGGDQITLSAELNRGSASLDRIIRDKVRNKELPYRIETLEPPSFPSLDRDHDTAALLYSENGKNFHLQLVSVGDVVWIFEHQSPHDLPSPKVSDALRTFSTRGVTMTDIRMAREAEEQENSPKINVEKQWREVWFSQTEGVRFGVSFDGELKPRDEIEIGPNDLLVAYYRNDGLLEHVEQIPNVLNAHRLFGYFAFRDEETGVLMAIGVGPKENESVIDIAERMKRERATNKRQSALVARTGDFEDAYDDARFGEVRSRDGVYDSDQGRGLKYFSVYQVEGSDYQIYAFVTGKEPTSLRDANRQEARVKMLMRDIQQSLTIEELAP